MATRVVGIEGLTAAIQAELDDITDEVRDAVKDAAKLGEKTTRDIIQREDRIDTGDMIGAVSSAILRDSPLAVTARFGLGNGPYYSVYQEFGFRHNRSGRWVKGMFAVTDAREVVVQFLNERISSI